MTPIIKSGIIYKGEFDSQKVTGLYSEEEIYRLCQAHDISHETYAKTLWHDLERAAQWYLAETENVSPKLTVQEEKKNLSDISRLVKSLSQKIEDMPDTVADAFYNSTNDIENERHEADPEGDDLDIMLTDLQAMQASLSDFELILKHAPYHIGSGKKGRPANKAVYDWVVIMSGFWERELKRPYKVDGYKGEVVTDAGNFLTDCLKPLDANAIDQLYSQMRRYRASCKPRS